MSHRTDNYVKLNGAVPIRLPSAEVEPKAKRCTFTREYKLAILTEADNCQASGEIGAQLRREGLDSLNLTA